MNKDILIITDSASDISNSMNLNHTTVMPLGFYLIGGNQYETEENVSVRRLNQLLNLDVNIRVLPVNYDNLYKVMDKAATEGKDIICIHTSDNFSFYSRNVFEKAKENVQLEHYETNIVVIDSYSISLGEAILVKEADRLVDSGNYSFEEIVDRILRFRSRIRFDYVTNSDNNYVYKFNTSYSDDEILKYIKSSFSLKNIYSINNVIKSRKTYKKGDDLGLILKGLYGKKNELIGVVKTGTDYELDKVYNDLICDSSDLIEVNANCVNNIYLGPKALGIVYKKR